MLHTFCERQKVCENTYNTSKSSEYRPPQRALRQDDTFHHPLKYSWWVIGPKGIAQNWNSVVVTKAVFSDVSSTLSIKQPTRIPSQGSYVTAREGVIQVKRTPCLVLLPFQSSHTSPFITLIQCPSSSSSHTCSMLIDMYKRYEVVKWLILVLALVLCCCYS